MIVPLHFSVDALGKAHDKSTLLAGDLHIQEMRFIVFGYRSAGATLDHRSHSGSSAHAYDCTLWQLEVADHLRPDRGAIDLAGGDAPRWRQVLLARRQAAGAGPLRGRK